MMARPAIKRIALTILSVVLCAQLAIAQKSLNQTPSITSADPEERRSAIYLLRLDCRPESARSAVVLANDPLPVVRASVAPLLACLPPAEAESHLVKLLADESPFVRKEAAYAFSDLTEPVGSAFLISAFARESDAEVRAAIITSIGAVGSSDALNLLIRILENRSKKETEFLRAAAARSIGQIAQRLSTGRFDRAQPQSFLPEKFKNLKPTNALEAFPVFANAVPPLEAAALDRSEDFEIRRAAVFSLGAIGSNRSLAVVRSAAASSDPFLSQIAHEALVRLGEKP